MFRTNTPPKPTMVSFRMYIRECFHVDIMKIDKKFNPAVKSNYWIWNGQKKIYNNDNNSTQHGEWKEESALSLENIWWPLALSFLKFAWGGDKHRPSLSRIPSRVMDLYFFSVLFFYIYFEYSPAPTL